MRVRHVPIVKSLLAGNDELAVRNRRRLTEAGVFTVNVMASPGAGKTSMIVRTLDALRGRARIGVIEGDIAGSIDAEKVLACGASDVVQINTGGGCHLEAGMVQRALDDLDLASLDMLFIENVGNLVCPTHWGLGEHRRLCLLSAPEGHDKPVKYPEIFATSDVVVLNKVDLIELVDFEREAFIESVRALNPEVPIIEVSCRAGTGLAAWTDWLVRESAVVRGQS